MKKIVCHRFASLSSSSSTQPLINGGKMPANVPAVFVQPITMPARGPAMSMWFTMPPPELIPIMATAACILIWESFNEFSSYFLKTLLSLKQQLHKDYQHMLLKQTQHLIKYMTNTRSFWESWKNWDCFKKQLFFFYCEKLSNKCNTEFFFNHFISNWTTSIKCNCNAFVEVENKLYI